VNAVRPGAPAAQRWRAARGRAVHLALGLALIAAAPGRAAAAVSPAEPEVQLVYRPPAAAPVAPVEPVERGRRALLEFSTLLLFENIRYWEANSFVEDWQFKLTWKEQKDKLLGLEGVRFDSNRFGTNWTHAFAGGLYYDFGRANSLGVKDSLLLATFEALYWELVVEWREVVSVNDLVSTIFGGFSMGEPYYQLTRYLLTRESPVARALGFVNPMLGVHAVLDPASRPRPTDAQTLPGHGVSLALGAATVDSRYASDSGGFASVGLRSRLALAPGYTAPGAETRQGWEVLSSTADFNLDLDGGAVHEIDVYSRAVFYGRLARAVGEDSRGSASVIGLGSAFTLFSKAPLPGVEDGAVDFSKPLELDGPRNFRDKYAIVHLVGPVYEGFSRGKGIDVAWAVEAYPDFGLVSAYALNEYSGEHDVSGTKSTLVTSGYYYGYGASLKALVEAGAGPVTAGVEVALHYHTSIEGLDRFEERLSSDVHASDSGIRIDANLQVAIPRTPLAIETTARWLSRRGEIGNTVTTGTETRLSLGVVYRL